MTAGCQNRTDTSNTNDLRVDLGPVKRWKDDDGIYHAENDWLALTWAVTDDPDKIGKLGFHGPKKICVEYISRETAEQLERRWGLHEDGRTDVAGGCTSGPAQDPD